MTALGKNEHPLPMMFDSAHMAGVVVKCAGEDRQMFKYDSPRFTKVHRLNGNLQVFVESLLCVVTLFVIYDNSVSFSDIYSIV